MTTGVILVNLGTPSEPSPDGVSRFLRAFLSDPRVVGLPAWLWQPLLNGLVIPLRRKRVAHAYQSIWMADGSPLMVYSRAQQRLLQDKLGTDYQVELAMTYGEPSLEHAWEHLKAADVNQVILLPLYPQYSSTTTAPVLDAWMRVMSRERVVPSFQFVRQHFDQQLYIAALAESILEKGFDPTHADFLLFSFHGIPESYVKKGDPYVEHCQETARQVASYLHLTDQQWQVSFQSRFGKAKWVEPYTDQTLLQLARTQPERPLFVICPAFSVDCLETLEEIAIGGRESYLAAGGQAFHYVPALNESLGYIETLAHLVHQSIRET